MTAKSASPELDIVLVGATGFVGRLVAAHLRDHADPDLKIAIAGRSRDKLAALGEELGGRAAEWPQILIDVTDKFSCDELAARTRVVVTTVGPYARYGHELIRACACAGTHYADLTGEVLFVRDAATGLHEVARESGARVVNACGFDSIPSDLGVWATAQRVAADGAGELTRTVLFVRALKGGISGGTIDSMRQQAEAMRTDAEARKAVADPYGLSPHRAAEPHKARPSRRNPRRSSRSPLTLAAVALNTLPVHRTGEGRWIGPFVMASFNTRIVRRTNALLDWAYGREFRYAEVMDYGEGLTAPVKATGMTAGLLGLVAGMQLGPTRALLDRALPAPGEGPDEESQRNGRFAMHVVAETTSGARYRTVVAADHDPGYSGTAIMLGQSALCLAEDELTGEGGVLTPAVAMGDALIDRLREQGFTIETHLDTPVTD